RAQAQLLERVPAAVERSHARAARLEQRAERLARVIVVVDDDDLATRKRDRVRGDIPARSRLAVGGAGHRANRKRGDVRRAGIAYGYRESSRMLLERSRARREVERRPGAARRLLVGECLGLGFARGRLGSDRLRGRARRSRDRELAGRFRDAQHDLVACALEPDLYAGPGLAHLDRMREQLPDDVLELRGIAGHETDV